MSAEGTSRHTSMVHDLCHRRIELSSPGLSAEQSQRLGPEVVVDFGGPLPSGLVRDAMDDHQPVK
ncbi:hypothetical protein ACWD5F_05615 [Streptomyces sp. NPDC002499]